MKALVRGPEAPEDPQKSGRDRLKEKDSDSFPASFLGVLVKADFVFQILMPDRPIVRVLIEPRPDK